MAEATMAPPAPTGGGARSFWSRELDHYPSPSRRYFYLGVVVLVTVTLYYLYYVEGTITPLFLPYLHMSFRFFLYLLVVSNAVGAFSALIGGLSDKIGRANLTIGGTFIVGVVQLAWIPQIHSRFEFAAAYTVIGFVEGIILVATPALMRDFSPQMGRASAMGFWALGPVLGSLAASLVATHTLTHLHPWQDQFVISGIVCLVVVVIAVFGLRELAPQIRDQLMVTETEKVLVEARAKGIDVEAAVAHPLRSMLRLDLVSSALAISLFLLIYYASVSVLTIYWVVVFSRTSADANGINVWYWAADAITLIAVGIFSDRLRVRKPFMLIGALGTIAMTIVLI
ncbi:MAG TPA: MFS transporter, partial [Acidimicrobiales bacterium]|nr:MFS transporter [Acidimicrobiales bacterium]